MPTRDEMNASLLAFKRKHGHTMMRRLLTDAAEVTAMSKVPESKIAAVIAATKEPPRYEPGEQTALARLNATLAELGDKVYAARKKRGKP